VGTISPLTDTFIDSNVGGHFGPLMKLAGFDALAISGISGEERRYHESMQTQTRSASLMPRLTAKMIDTGRSFFTAKKLLLDANNGAFSDTLAAVVAGQGALHSRFGRHQ